MAVGCAQRIMYRTTDAHGARDRGVRHLLRREPAVDRCGPPPTGRSGARHAGAGRPVCAVPTLPGRRPLQRSAGLRGRVRGAAVHAPALARGIDRHVVNRLQGLGTAGTQATSPPCAGHAMLDAARAVKALPGSRIGDDNPIGFWGYSQGGGRGGSSAAENAAAYAPDLDVRGDLRGWAAAELRAVAGGARRRLATGLLGYAVNSIYAGYPETAPTSTARSLPRVEGARRDCRSVRPGDDRAIRVAPHTRVDEGRTLARRTHRRAAVGERGGDEQRIGRSTPGSPVLNRAGRQRRPDSAQPGHSTGRRLVRQGATVGSAPRNPTDRTGVRRRTRPADGVGPAVCARLADRPIRRGAGAIGGCSN